MVIEFSTVAEPRRIDAPNPDPPLPGTTVGSCFPASALSDRLLCVFQFRKPLTIGDARVSPRVRVTLAPRSALLQSGSTFLLQMLTHSLVYSICRFGAELVVFSFLSMLDCQVEEVGLWFRS